MLALRLQGLGEEFVSQPTVGGGVSRRAYSSYDPYTQHQKSKLEVLSSGGRFALDGTDLQAYDVTFRAILRERIQSLDVVGQGKSVLCLAARLGTEVKAFLDCGCFAIGVDLNPGKDNPFVIPGDFHHLVFSAGSVDLVYCNSLDHAFDLELLFAEIRRVLKSGGYFIADIPYGDPGRFESLSWESTDTIQLAIQRQGFDVERMFDFTRPWRGRCVVAAKALE